MKRHRALITAALAAASVLAAIAVAPADAAGVTFSPDRRTTTQAAIDALNSSKSLDGLNALEGAIAASGACSLPAPALSKLIIRLISSPLVAKTGLASATARVCANIDAVGSPMLSSSAITSMWAWGNPVSESTDSRGLGEAEFAPATISDYATAHHLTNVRLAAPWASDQGAAIRGWLSDSVSALHAGRQTVSALGGETAWVADPSLVSRWITAAHSAAPFDGVQLDVEPWTTDPNWTTNPSAIAGYVAMVRTAAVVAHSLGLTLGIDAPWWLSTTPYLSGSALTAVLPYVDSVSIVAFSDHAGGTDGIIAQAWPAVIEANAALTPYTIGVQTSSDEVSGGAHYTFADKGSAALEAETAKVRAAYTGSVGYSGVTVEEYLSWTGLGD